MIILYTQTCARRPGFIYEAIHLGDILNRGDLLIKIGDDITLYFNILGRPNKLTLNDILY